MRKTSPRKWLHACLDLLPVILIPVFMIYSHRHDVTENVSVTYYNTMTKTPASCGVLFGRLHASDAPKQILLRNVTIQSVKTDKTTALQPFAAFGAVKSTCSLLNNGGQPVVMDNVTLQVIDVNGNVTQDELKAYTTF